MKIEKLTDLCNEYSSLIIKKELLEYSIDSHKKYPHLEWAIERDMTSIFGVVNRIVDIQEILTDMGEIEF